MVGAKSQGSERPTFRRLRRHFEALVELEPAARARRLEHWQQRDPALARELAALLAADAAPPGVLDGNALFLFGVLLGDAEPEAEPPSRDEESSPEPGGVGPPRAAVDRSC